ENLHLTMMDATCFESYVRYPTDVKLLWECVERLWEVLIPKLYKRNRHREPYSNRLAKQRGFKNLLGKTMPKK
ncbi:MAG: DDE transposase, partial [Cytophagales bacterium]